MAPQVLHHLGARPTETKEALWTPASLAHPHPSTEDHDDTVEAHYSALERLRPHACYDGVVYMTYVAFDEEAGEEVEQVECVPCRRCAELRVDGVF